MTKIEIGKTYKLPIIQNNLGLVILLNFYSKNVYVEIESKYCVHLNSCNHKQFFPNAKYIIGKVKDITDTNTGMEIILYDDKNLKFIEND
jgi:hypothetical protein